ncbi:MAG TPA: hypothetical protein VI256_04165 [Roseiarcus sp.]
MTIEILYLTAQMQRWLNVQVARHLEAQAAKIRRVKGAVTLGPDGPGGSVGLDREGMPEGRHGAELEAVATMDGVTPDASPAKFASENHRVPA